MAFFKKRKAEEPERLDWLLMQHGAVTLYHKGAVLNEDAAWFQRNGYVVHSLDASRWDSAPAFHGDVKRVLGFPPHYTNNLASWIDALAELDVPMEGGLVLVLKGFETFARAEHDLAQIILDSVESASRRFLLTGRRLVALVQSGDPRIRFERIGAVPVVWNPREWTETQRGIVCGE
ncbi:MAG: barstar family protein [Gemmatimonadota bacterium]|nr:barstar family protein [Gemmatimonadota bacterium]